MRSNADLVREAQRGEVASLGELLRRLQPRMRAVAMACLRDHADAEDACQDAAVLAIARIGELRDPEAVPQWLNAIVRNACHAIARRQRPTPTDPAALRDTAASLDDPARLIEERATRDWLWHGLAMLSPQVRLVAMLRWFTAGSSYQEVARVSGVTVSTVRSRLAEARKQLARNLAATTEESHSDVSALVNERHAEVLTVLNAVACGIPAARVYARWYPDADITWPDGRVTGIAGAVRALYSDYADGVQYRLRTVLASPGLTLVEKDFLNPSTDPDHCPPTITWLLSEVGGRVRSARLIYSERPAAVLRPSR
ncbi:MAG TPA: sigma-70 family RNA polymerase sigma factor [Rugosimonospora sp.]|nr:sigma-70 family RNA polymerase sigma factor [Rugosimonospora sp.]